MIETIIAILAIAVLIGAAWCALILIWIAQSIPYDPRFGVHEGYWRGA